MQKRVPNDRVRHMGQLRPIGDDRIRLMFNILWQPMAAHGWRHNSSYRTGSKPLSPCSLPPFPDAPPMIPENDLYPSATHYPP